MPLSPPLTLAVLAGGRGARLGGCIKPLATKDGQTLVTRILETLGPSASAHFLVAPAALEAALAPFGDVVFDPGEGPGPAVMAAAAAAKTPWLLVVAGDHVSPTRALLDALWSAREGRDAVCVTDEGRAQGGFALYRVAALARCPRPEPFSLWRLFEALDTAYLPASDLPEAARAGLLDVDTASDVARHGLELP